MAIFALQVGPDLLSGIPNTLDVSCMNLGGSHGFQMLVASTREILPESRRSP